MKKKTKNILCKNTKFDHKLWIKCHYAESKSLFQKTINTTSCQASTNPNHCLFIKVKTKNEKNRKKSQRLRKVSNNRHWKCTKYIPTKPLE